MWNIALIHFFDKNIPVRLLVETVTNIAVFKKKVVKMKKKWDGVALAGLLCAVCYTSGVQATGKVDTDGDGLTDALEAFYGTDAHNPDTDGDGLSDGDEIGTYLTDPLNPDTDDDGLTDGDEVGRTGTDPLATDTDGDGVGDADEIDSGGEAPGSTDSDGDGLSDSAEQELGTDVSNPDTDGDGVSDGQESVTVGGANITDTDGDGVVNANDLDSDNDGLPDQIEGIGDTDNDGIADAYDLDSDNDGIADLLEAGGADTDLNGRVDGFSDVNSDGWDDATAAAPLAIPDSDGDGVADFRDLDSDNDGIPDLVEAGDSDANGDGRVDNFSDASNDGLADSAAQRVDLDTDMDGLPNRIDLDSDADGLSDLLESGGVDANNDQRVDDFADSNGDGFDDALAGVVLVLEDADGDGIADVIDMADGPVLNDDDVNASAITGIDGSPFGCSIAIGNSRLDPVLPMLMLGALAGLYGRRRKSY